MIAENLTQCSSPIFIVGAPRSGTTMLAAMIGSHSQYAIGPETQFFSKLAPEALDKALADPKWPDLACSLLSGLTLAEQPVIALFGTRRGDVADFLAARSPSRAAILEALTVPFAAKRGKPNWAEKTPNHLLNLHEIRSCWPDAAIVRIMRDPRDAAISTCRLPSFSDSFAANIYMWRIWQDTARDFLATDEKSYTIRYESLVDQPEKEMSALCKFLGISYEQGMLDFSAAAGDVSSSAEHWKKPVSHGLSRDRMFAWKTSISADMSALANAVTYEYLEAFGYEHEPHPENMRSVYRMSDKFVERHEPFLLSLARSNIRWLPAASPEGADMIAEQPAYHQIRKPDFLIRLMRTRLFLAVNRKTALIKD